MNIAVILGEDAVNTAWVIFLEFIQNYKGDKFRLLPGLIRHHLHYELLHTAYRSSTYKDAQALESSDEYMEQRADKKDPISECEAKILLKQAMEKLSTGQKAAIQAIDLEGYGFREYCAQKSCTHQNITGIRAKAYKKLREALRCS